ncbi:rit1 DUSP-like domain-containing protein [Sarocladium implicatum]|nr:rit1 DUSP-like domain-containing protein [Sarocladium implicatum]
MPDPSYSSLIFPLASQPSPLTSLKRSPLTIHNRLASIVSDAEFVRSASTSSRLRGRPVVANERCGSWYVPPEGKGGSAYFKSTDGHERAWKFSTRRLNLHLVEMIEKNDGIIIVDSTRRGKRMPDALSTTIPIWCTVLNLALLPLHPLSPILHLPPSHLPTTHAQITALIPEFLTSLKALNLPLEKYKLTKPLRPYWVTRDSDLQDSEQEEGTAESATIFEDYRPVVCCTASRRVQGSEVDEGGYIQGAGDDTENWAHGLTPPVFWAHSSELLAAAEADLPDLIANLVTEHQEETMAQKQAWREVTKGIAVQQLPLGGETEAGVACHIALTSQNTPRESWVKSKKLMQIGLGKSKTASRNLRNALPEICAFAAQALHQSSQPDTGALGTIVVACETGRDISIGAALALWCRLYDDEGNMRPGDGAGVSFSKDAIKARLGIIMMKFPDVNPNRATLQSVNSYLMDWS